MQRRGKGRGAAAGLVFTLSAAVLLGACSNGEAEPENPDRAEATEGEGIADVVVLDSAARSAIQLALVLVERIETTTLLATGVIDYDQNHVSRVGPRAEGRVVSVVADLGMQVVPGQPLAVLESPELGEAQGELTRASAELEVARENHEREQELYEQQISSRKEMLEAKAAHESAAASLRVAEARLRTLGATPGGDGAQFSVSSPLAGKVVERNVVPGQISGSEDQLFTVADLSRLWLILDLYEKDLGRVRAGQPVEVRTQAFPGAVFPGRIAHVGLVVDPSTRTLKVRVVVDNLADRLRPGMFAQAGIQVTEAVALAVVPEAAVQDVGGRSVVFIPEGAEGSFRMIDVLVGPKVGDGRVALLSGIEPGQMVVGRGAFFLKSELLKDTFADDES